MSSVRDITLFEQRQTLRLRLQEQRQLIAYRLGPAPFATSGYPRSMTMRFLTQRPDLAVRLLSGLATLLVGRRYFRVVATAVAVAGIVRSIAITRPGRLSAPPTPDDRIFDQRASDEESVESPYKSVDSIP
jgi:hypothetical protein